MRNIRMALLVAILIALPMIAMAGSEAEMAEWQQAATPGAPHEELAQQAGSWTYVVTIWDEPGADPMQLEGIARKKMVMGGRFLQEELSGGFMGREFTGFGVTGYDNVAGEFATTWIDNMSTKVYFAIGKTDGSGSHVFRSEQLNPGGEKVKIRSLTRTIDKNHHTYESYATKPGGKEYLHMRVEYTRVGA